jgi:hypothetical protein
MKEFTIISPYLIINKFKRRKTMTIEKKTQVMKRRNFLKLSGISLLSLPFIAKAKVAYGRPFDRLFGGYWVGPEDGRYCVHRTVYTGDVDSGYIWARVDGWWRRFQIREAEENFWAWNFDERMKRLLIQYEPEWDAVAGGPAQPHIATYGNPKGRGDSTFHLNSKVIYQSLAPKEEHCEEINNTMFDMIEAGANWDKDVLPWWVEIHENRDLWCKDRQVGLEVFTTPEFETHTFLNLMENPVATMGYHAIYDNNISYELRCIAQIAHPRDPNLSDYEKGLALHTSLQIVLAHGFASPDFIYDIPGVIYYHIEEFDNSFGAQGKKLVGRINKENMKRLF